MSNIEVELRSLINEQEYKRLVDFFDNNSRFLGDENQITYYYDCEQDLRIQQSDDYSKIWLKKGNLHDEAREEMEIRFAKEDFFLLDELFTSLNFKKQVEWYRKRKNYSWGDDIKVSLDYTEGYGYIFELEILTSFERQEHALALLRDKFKDLSITITPKEEFDAKYENYKNNWNQILKK